MNGMQGIPFFLGCILHNKKIYQLSIVIFVVSCIYYPVLFSPFNSIDDNAMVNSLLNVDELNLYETFFPGSTGQYYRPLLYLTFFNDNFLWGLEASFMHLENILLHVGSAVLVFAICRQILYMLQLQGPWLPLTTALLFGLHPIATEPVNWVSGRTDLLAGFFVLACLLLFLKSQNRQRIWLGCAGALLLLAGCLSKETALFILPLLLLWCLLPPKDLPARVPVRVRLSLFGVYLLAGLCYLAMRWSALSGGDKIVITTTSATSSTGEVFGLWDLLRVGLKTTGFYLKKLLMPLPLNFGIVEISPIYLWLGLAVCGGLLYCLYLRTTVAYLLLAAFCLVSPALILPLLKITWTPVAERYAYIASAPFVMALSLLFVRHLQPVLSPRLVTIGVFLLLVGASTATAQRNIIWQDNLTLFEDTVRKSPTFAAAKNELAIALNERGRKEEAHALLLANSGDDYQPATLNKVRVYMQQGKLEQAYSLLQQYQQKTVTSETLELQNKLNELRLKQAQPEQQQAIWAEMLATLQKLQVMTGDPFYHYRIGQVQLRLGEKSAAKESFAKAYQGAPPNSHYREAARKLAERL